MWTELRIELGAAIAKNRQDPEAFASEVATEVSSATSDEGLDAGEALAFVGALVSALGRINPWRLEDVIATEGSDGDSSDLYRAPDFSADHVQ